MSIKLSLCSQKNCSNEELNFNKIAVKTGNKIQTLSQLNDTNILEKMKKINENMFNSKENKNLNRCQSNKCQIYVKEFVDEYVNYALSECKTSKNKKICDFASEFIKISNKKKIFGADKRMLEMKYIQSIMS